MPLKIELIKDYVDVIAKLIGVAALAFGVWKYFQDREMSMSSERMENTLSQIDRLYSFESSSNLDLIVREFSPLFTSKTRPIATDVERYFKYVVSASPDIEVILSSYSSLLFNFDSIARCAEDGLCDEEIVVERSCTDFQALLHRTKPMALILRDRGFSGGQFSEEYYENHC